MGIVLFIIIGIPFFCFVSILVGAVVRKEFFDYDPNGKNSSGINQTIFNLIIGGIVKTYSFSPIFLAPNINSKEVGTAESNKVIILNRYNNDFYKVKSGDVEGYISKNDFRKK